MTVDAREVITTAEARFGSGDWGGDDWIEGLEVLLQSCAEQAELSAGGWRHLKDACVHHLGNRVRIENLVVRHPEILDEEIVRPMFLVTFPRSGSSLLHRLLCQDPGIRAPLYGEIYQPAPALGVEPTTGEREERIRQADELFLQPLEDSFPEGAAARGTMPGASEAGECYVLFENSFTSFNYTFDYHILDYLDWLCQLDFELVYRYFKKQLQVLQWQAPGQPWTMKCADHMIGLDGLLKVFPDANLVVIHRDPQKMVPSLGNLQACHMNLWRREPMDREVLGRYCLERYQRIADQGANLRDRVASEQYYELTYRDLAADPIAEVRRLMEYFEYSIHPQAEQRLQAYLDAHPKPNNRYSLDAYGLKESQVDSNLATYAGYYEETANASQRS